MGEEKILANLIILLCSYILIKLNRVCKKTADNILRCRCENTFLVDLIYDAFFLKAAVFYLFPAILHVIFNWSIQEKYNVSPIEISIVYLVETFSCGIYYWTFNTLIKKTHKRLGYLCRTNTASDIIVITILAIYIVLQFASFTFDESFVENFTNKLFFILPFVKFLGCSLSVFVIVIGKRCFKKTTVFIAIIALISYFLLALTSGVRGTLVWPFILYLYLVFKFKHESFKKTVVLVFICMLPIAVFQSQFVNVRFDMGKALTLSEKIDLLFYALENDNFYNSPNTNSNFFKEADYRFGAMTMYSVGFYRMANRGSYAGLECIKNSFYVFLPRLFVEDKPIPTSVDGTLYGMGMYKTVTEIEGEGSMCEFSTSAHAYWELGLIGVILFSIIPAIYIFLNIKLFRNFDMLGFPFLIVILFPWYNEPKLWISEIVLQLGQVILPVYMILFLYKLLRKKS